LRTKDLGARAFCKSFGFSQAISVATEIVRIRPPKYCYGKDLAAGYSVFKELFLTAFARAMMNEFEVGRKVRCHKAGLWKIPGDQIVGDIPRSQNPKGFGVVESHLSQRTRKMGHPALLYYTFRSDWPNSFYGLLVILAGVPVFEWFRRHRSQ